MLFSWNYIYAVTRGEAVPRVSQKGALPSYYDPGRKKGMPASKPAWVSTSVTDVPEFPSGCIIYHYYYYLISKCSGKLMIPRQLPRTVRIVLVGVPAMLVTLPGFEPISLWRWVNAN